MGESLNAGNTSIEGVFDIKNPNGDAEAWDRLGFDPSTETISQIEVAFSFRDASRNKQRVTISLGDLSVGQDINIGIDSDFLYQKGVPLFGGDFWITLQNYGEIAWRVDLNDPQADSNIELRGAYLAANVPDSGSTMAFLGFSFFGLCLFARRRTARERS